MLGICAEKSTVTRIVQTPLWILGQYSYTKP